ncbi:MAG: cell wall hydrolase [Holosporales bacterium]|jgi:spore germination cell wall hydrolase CwlJ-like protein|nr:cell wall hydrolase [Holosporales bacterium]
MNTLNKNANLASTEPASFCVNLCPISALSDLDILARTIYGEARGEFQSFGLASLIGVGNVVANRVKSGGWFGQKISEVCLKPKQFSCWNPDDANSTIIKQTPEQLERHPVFGACEEVALHIIRGDWPDLTKGANHYYSSLIKTPPLWSKGRECIVKIGHHLFFKI